MRKAIGDKETIFDVIVIGAGAGGILAAGRSGELGARVLLLEKTSSCGNKILVSGKTRCNLTNSAELNNFLAMYGPNGRFLRNVYHSFFRPELIDFFDRHGVRTKEERGGRIFPVSDDARDVVCALENYLAEAKVQLRLNEPVVDVGKAPGSLLFVRTKTAAYRTRAVIMATGGAAWPQTGSTGDGYGICAGLGHKIVELKPALVPLIVQEIDVVRALQDVTLRNVRVTAFQGKAGEIDSSLIPGTDYGRGKKNKPHPPVLESRFGEMLFTHFGLAGPVILLISLGVVEALSRGPVSILIDLKPALNRRELRLRLQKDLDKYGKKTIGGIMKDYLPGKMIDVFITASGVNPAKEAHQINAREKENIVECLKAWRFNVKKSLPLARAIVTAGGVSLREIDPRTMASRLIPGLYFCGEIMDIDADTGGYNLQAAFSTGYVAGENAARYALQGKDVSPGR